MADADHEPERWSPRFEWIPERKNIRIGAVEIQHLYAFILAHEHRASAAQKKVLGRFKELLLQAGYVASNNPRKEAGDG